MKKKIFSILLIAVMVLASVGTAFAAADGTVTVSGTHKDQKYKLYKLFDAEITFGSDGKTVNAITYKVPEGKSIEGNAWFEENDNGFVVIKEGVDLTADVMKGAEFQAWVKEFGVQVGEEKTAAADGAEVKWTGLEYGYYYVDSTLGATVGISTAQPNATIQDKNNPPRIDKEITNTTTAGATMTDEPNEAECVDIGEGKNEHAVAQVGDTVSYKVTVKAKAGAENYVVTDTMEHLDLVADSIRIDGTPAASYANATTTTEARKFTIAFTKAYLDSITEDTDIVITYDAILASDALIAYEGPNSNTVKLTWGHDNDSNWEDDDSHVWTATVDVNKKINSAEGDPLEGAGFVLVKDGKYYAKGTDNKVTWVDDIKDATELFTGADGKLVGKFTGLTVGSYTLVEKTVPAGYNKTNDAKFSITKEAPHDETLETSLSQEKTVINNAGTTMPETGGMGTTIIYILGAALVIGAGVVLVSRKRSNDR